jgi:hypothetical protein
MMTMLDEVLWQCGFIGTLIVGGPDPDVPNSIMSMVFQSGKTATGLSFNDAYPELKATMTSSFNSFAHKCLSTSIVHLDKNYTHHTPSLVVNKPGAEPTTSPAKAKPQTGDSSTSTGTDTTGDRQVSERHDIGPDDFAIGENGGGGDMIDSDMIVDPPELETLPMDTDTIPNDGESNETAAANHNNGQSSGAVTGGVAGEDSDENGDDIAMQGEHMAKPEPVIAPANRRPVYYLGGKRVSEYEWIRAENIKNNEKLLEALELKNAGEQLFKKRGGKGKENQPNGGDPSKKRKERKQLPWANMEKRTLRSMGKAVPDR